MSSETEVTVANLNRHTFFMYRYSYYVNIYTLTFFSFIFFLQVGFKGVLISWTYFLGSARLKYVTLQAVTTTCKFRLN